MLETINSSIQLKDLVIKTPTTKRTIPFDPDTFITDKNWNAILNEINNFSEGITPEGELIRFSKMVTNLHTIKPELFPQIKITQNIITTYSDLSKRYAFGWYILKDLWASKILLPENWNHIAPTHISLVEQNVSYFHQIEQKLNDQESYVGRLFSSFHGQLLYPNNPKFQLSPEEKSHLFDELPSLQQSKIWEGQTEYFAGAKALGIVNIKLTADQWDESKNLIFRLKERALAGERIWVLILKHATYLAMLAADEVTINNSTLKINLHKPNINFSHRPSAIRRKF